jgi:hypothetical protein
MKFSAGFLKIYSPAEGQFRGYELDRPTRDVFS